MDRVLMPAPPAPPTDAMEQPFNWWFLSGVMVTLGALVIGLGVILLAVSIGDTFYPASYVQGLLVCTGVGIMFIGSSWACARAAPRNR